MIKSGCPHQHFVCISFNQNNLYLSNRSYKELSSLKIKFFIKPKNWFKAIFHLIKEAIDSVIHSSNDAAISAERGGYKHSKDGI